jgi:hypothetical protein
VLLLFTLPLWNTYFRTHIQAVSNSCLPRLQAQSFIFLLQLCLHLPKKALRPELSFNWFQECTYLYLSHVYCNCSIRRAQASIDRRQMFSRADLIVLSVQNHLLLHNIKSISDQSQSKHSHHCRQLCLNDRFHNHNG